MSLTELSKRAAACTQVSAASGKPKWSVLHGMAVVSDRLMMRGTVVECRSARVLVCSEDGQLEGFDAVDLRPEFRDPLTAGSLPYLVRRAWGDQTLHSACLGYDEGEMVWEIQKPLRFGSSPPGRLNRCLGPTELDAWIVALESAP